MTLHMGRSGNALEFGTHYVRKTVVGPDEPCYMKRFPSVFVSVHRLAYGANGLVEFDMPRLRAVGGGNVREHLPAGARLLTKLWAQPRVHKTDTLWHEKLRTHLLIQLREVLTAYGLPVHEIVNRFTDALPPKPEREVPIHGDPTLANLLYEPRLGQHRWCDPLLRDFIPGDPLVDLGKLFQSCWDYEGVVLGRTEQPRWDERLARDVLEATGHGTCPATDAYQGGIAWCYVHLLRLLPYADDRTRGAFVGVVRAWLEAH